MRRLFPMFLSAAVLLGAAAARAADAPPAPVSAEELLKRTDLLVNLEAPNVPLDEALRVLAKQFGLSIVTARNVNTVVNASLRNVTLVESLNSLVTINGFAYRAKGSVIEVYQPSAVQVPPEVEQPRVETFRLKYANADKTKTLLKSFLGKEGKMEADVNNNALIVYDTPGSIQAMTKVIEKLDVPEAQVSISAEIIEASLDASQRLGVDWKTKVALTGASRPLTFPFSADKSGSRWVPGNNPAVDGGFDPTQSFPYPVAEDFIFGTLDATGLKVALELLKSDTGTQLVANPEITTLNNREAKINIGDSVPVPTYTTNLETGVTAVTGFQQIDTGTILIVTPQVTEGRTITLSVKPEVSQITGYKGQFDERPIVSSRKAETTVRLNDGETLVIGGLVSETVTNIKNKVPILGDVPLFGWFFRYESNAKVKKSLYIFITPRVLDDQRIRDRARQAGERLFQLGFTKPDTNGTDLRNPGATPFK